MAIITRAKARNGVRTSTGGNEGCMPTKECGGGAAKPTNAKKAKRILSPPVVVVATAAEVASILNQKTKSMYLRLRHAAGQDIKAATFLTIMVLSKRLKQRRNLIIIVIQPNVVIIAVCLQKQTTRHPLHL